MITSYNLEFCDIDVYEDYTVARIHEGMITTPENLKVFLKLIDIHYKNKPFVYISHRIHSFSINPAIHAESSKIPNLIGIAVVSEDPLQKIQTQVEKVFFKKEFKHFTTIQEALVWKDEIIKKVAD
ncbi:STAS/SEC14 domain-containing protein [Aquimarina sp. AD10]|uniref:STAS/SEC14 domain-containing protein n=1 Tax=Aquimarina aggregata TaxID=1642818 RepID=A0A163B8Z7_9FLAO|nr:MULTISPECIES: STAS/SEC14 domain-containing protein [Aquimarina]AXT59131.1 STAS/SEC14 domain-containing protein [Aquimarina sp. AD10]KZS41143.1 hypothetical protein AWE51_23625 [Aquimarina aggregata]RKM93081.1 STAS/SEC14 domain-containing protein [Aquimarina sp. AD10]